MTDKTNNPSSQSEGRGRETISAGVVSDSLLREDFANDAPALQTGQAVLAHAAPPINHTSLHEQHHPAAADKQSNQVAELIKN